MTPRGVIVLVAVAALVAHAPAVEGEFVFHDDFRYVVSNDAIDAIGNPLRFFTDLSTLAPRSPTKDIYRPVRTLSFAVVTSLCGKESAAPFHALAILLHAGTAALLAALLLHSGLGRFAAAAGPLAFALHPATVEVTAWVCSLGDGWCGLFSVASVLLYAKGRRVLAALALVLALFSKEHALVVPGLWFAWDLFVRGLRRGALVRAFLAAAAPGLALALGFLLFRDLVAGARMAQLPGPLGGSHAAALFTMAAGLGWYGATILFPYGPTFDAVVDVRDTPLSLAVLLGLFVLAALGWAVARGPARVRFGAAWFLLALVPVSNVFVPLKIPTADRFLYVPLMGLAFCVGELAERTRPFAARWMVPALALLAALAVARIGDWRSSEALLAAGLRVAPKSHRLVWEQAALSAERAIHYLERGDFRTAERLAEKAVRDYERYLRASLPGEQTQVYVELGRLLDAIGQGRVRYAPERRREAQSRALEAYVAARRLQSQGVGRTTEEEVRLVARGIVALSADLAEPSNPNLGATIEAGLEAAHFLKERYGEDDTRARIVFRLADSVRVRGQEPERAREGFDWVLDAIGRLEAGGARLPFERAQALFYRAVLDRNRADLERAFRIYQEAAQDRRVRLRALAYAGRCACTIWRLFGDDEWAARGRKILEEIPAVAARENLGLDSELRNEIRTIESACGG